jgi:hypothetical protein
LFKNQIRSGRFSIAENIIVGSSQWYIIPLALFVTFRIFLIGLEFHMTGGNEFAMDRWNFELGLKPLSVLTFNIDTSSYSQPPLYPIIIAPLALPLSQITNDFLAPRITYTFFELVGFILMIWFLAKSFRLNKLYKFYVLLILCFSPLGFMAGAVMKQEEAVVLVFTSAVLLAWRKGSIKAASFLTFMGVICAKILFGIVFISLLLYEKDNRSVLVWGLIPTAVFLSIYSGAGYLITGTIPFVDFAPSKVDFCCSFFSLLLRYTYISGSLMKWLSLSLIMATTAAIWIYRKRVLINDFPLLMAFSFLILFIFFYHINTEYYIFILPLLAYIPFAIESRRLRILLILLHLILSAVTWGYGVIYGIRKYAEGSGYRSASKDIILDLYDKTCGFIPPWVFEIILLAATIFTIAFLGLIVFRLLLRKTAAI